MDLREGILLIVDDQKPICQILSRILMPKGLTVYTTDSAHEALYKLEEHAVDIVITDVHMPDMSGLELLQEIKRRYPDILVIMITASHDIEIAKNSFRFGAYDFLTKPFDSDDVWISVSRALDYRHLILEKQKYQQYLEEMVVQKTRDLRLTVIKLEDALLHNKSAHLETTIVLAKIAEINDEDTGNHLKRVSRYSEHLSQAMQLPETYVDQIRYSSTMHDIGKILIDPMILKKADQLNPQEFEIMKMHTVYGGRILENVPFLQTAHDIALYHHENYDGSGYPYGLKGATIPLPARIVTLCDVFDALIADRCYKKAYNLDTAVTILKTEVGRRFDPEIANVFFQMKDLMYQIYTDLRST